MAAVTGTGGGALPGWPVSETAAPKTAHQTGRGVPAVR